jgi:hypothetical protein
VKGRMGIGVKIWIEQIGNLGFTEVELDDIGFLRATDRARSATFVEPKQRIKSLDRRHMNPQRIWSLLPDRTALATFLDYLQVA